MENVKIRFWWKHYRIKRDSGSHGAAVKWWRIATCSMETIRLNTLKFTTYCKGFALQSSGIFPFQAFLPSWPPSLSSSIHPCDFSLSHPLHGQLITTWLYSIRVHRMKINFVAHCAIPISNGPATYQCAGFPVRRDVEWTIENDNGVISNM